MMKGIVVTAYIVTVYAVGLATVSVAAALGVPEPWIYLPSAILSWPAGWYGEDVVAAVTKWMCQR